MGKSTSTQWMTEDGHQPVLRASQTLNNILNPSMNGIRCVPVNNSLGVPHRLLQIFCGPVESRVICLDFPTKSSYPNFIEQNVERGWRSRSRQTGRIMESEETDKEPAAS